MTNPEPSRPVLRARLRLWFLANPDDTLTAPDAAAKFGAHRITAAIALRALKDENLIDYAGGHRNRPAQYALSRQTIKSKNSNNEKMEPIMTSSQYKKIYYKISHKNKELRFWINYYISTMKGKHF